ncbi:WGR domain-containing protein [Pyxidicoccus sp. 3LFB2]
MPRFELKEGRSNKFWEITREENVLLTRWGRIGTEGQEKTQEFKQEYEARSAYEKQVQEKTKKGYTRIKPADTAARPKSNKQLEAAILRAPDEAEGYLVYGDWLQSVGDPRGELIAVQHALPQAKGARAKVLMEREVALLQQHRDTLLGAPLSSMCRSLWLTVQWHLGFIRSARLGVSSYGDDPEFQFDETLAMLLAHPSARFLQELTLGLAADDGQNEYGDLIKRIAKKAPKTLRQVFIGAFVYPRETEISWTHVGDVSPLYKALPQLRSLRLCGGDVHLGKINLPELREFTVETGGLPLSAVKSIAAAKWPKLEKLEVWFGSASYGAGGQVKHLQSILDADGLPELEHLGLCNAEFTNDLVTVLPKSRVLKQLQTLDLSRGTLTDKGAEVLLANAAAFKHLQKLNLTQNLLSPKAAKSLSKLCADVVVGHQRRDTSDEDDDHRYVAVGE